MRNSQFDKPLFWIISHLFLFHINASGYSLIVTQNPTEVDIHLKTSVSLSCQWTTNSSAQKVRVIWYKTDQPANELQTVVLNGTERTNTFSLKISRSNDSGVYICKVIVEIPLFLQQQGNGTQVFVYGYNSTMDAGLSWKVLTAACAGGAAVLLILAAGCLALRRTLKQEKKEEPSVPIYMNSTQGFQKKQMSSDNKWKKMNEDHGPENTTVSKTLPDSYSNQFIRVDCEDIFAVQRKMKNKRANFFMGNANSSLNTEGKFQRKRSLHIYINSRDLRKQTQQPVGDNLAHKICDPVKNHKNKMVKSGDNCEDV
ncbi:uncharacterized protein [Lepisosteus oculatus]|uniref:uncharacterized protein isoform X1 n=2 Tax=Lepisosteus oculatus TaxID=7918 RepID=UPI00073FD40D|nr:PREDICTED: uncharacterized protein LOC107077099 isoform X1 [Lepisosteus oculatus]